jgi:hypothetical protein
MLTDTRIRNAKPKQKRDKNTGKLVLDDDGKPVLTPNKLSDGKGLYVEVRPTGAKMWRYRYRIDGKENVYTIGEYFDKPQPGHVSLDDARARRIEARKLVKEGEHPKAHREQQEAVKRAEAANAAANTLESVAREWIARCIKGVDLRRAWTAAHAGSVQRTLEFEFVRERPYLCG